MTDRLRLICAVNCLYINHGKVNEELLYSRYRITKEEIEKEFGSLSMLLHVAGLGFLSNENISKEEMIRQANYTTAEDLLSVAGKHNQAISRSVYEREGNYTIEEIEKDFNCTFEEVLEAYCINSLVEKDNAKEVEDVNTNETESVEVETSIVETEENSNTEPEVQNNAPEEVVAVTTEETTNTTEEPRRERKRYAKLNEFNSVRKFFDKKITIFSGEETKNHAPVLGQDLYKEYVSYCKFKSTEPVGKNTFYKEIDRININKTVDSNRRTLYTGIEISKYIFYPTIKLGNLSYGRMKYYRP